MIIPEALQARDDFKDCASFHGHTCMGLTLGYLAAKRAMQYLEEKRARDEDLVCITETDGCCCDAIQVLTGCTFGKGNLIYHDIGKIAFTFASRTSGIGVRVAMRPNVMAVPHKERLLAEKIRAREANSQEISEYEELQKHRSRALFDRGPAAFFTLQEISLHMPAIARIAPSLPCDDCREPVMMTKLLEIDGQKLCRTCREKTGRNNGGD